MLCIFCGVTEHQNDGCSFKLRHLNCLKEQDIKPQSQSLHEKVLFNVKGSTSVDYTNLFTPPPE